MAKASMRVSQSQAKAKREGSRYSLAAHAASEATGILLLFLALLSGLAVLSYEPADPLWMWTSVSNRAGIVGAHLAAMLFRSFGVGSLVVVGLLAVLGVRLLLGRGIPVLVSRFWLGSVALLFAVSTLPVALAGFAPQSLDPVQGGWLGQRAAAVQVKLLSDWGSLILNFGCLFFGALAVLGISSRDALSKTWGAAQTTADHTATALSFVGRAFSVLHQIVQRAVQGAEVWRERRARLVRVAEAREKELLSHGEPQPVAPTEISAADLPRKPAAAPQIQIIDHAAEAKASKKKPKQEAFAFSDRKSGIAYELPSLDVFQSPPPATRPVDHESLIMRSRIVEKKLRDFGVDGRVVTVHPGPVITMYEFEPAPGVKVNKIVALADDLALALRALTIRIVAPIPGKSVVGIEVPNADRETVYIRQGFESDVFREADAALPLFMGKDIFGASVAADLSRMPHLLVAGATGTGKSVFLNSLICSLLCRRTPDELKLLLIDPKLLELSIYENIPHLIAEVVTNPKRAAAALHGIVSKMEERYRKMAALGVRNIQQYNERVDQELKAGNKTFKVKGKPGEEDEEAAFERISYIVVVIDELADLMMVSARDVEEALQRLAQMARAAGIHLVLATQRPSVDVLTGVIKANFPSRVAFQVSSKTDSRTILDQNGAEQLLGQGDMLFLPPGTSKIQRIHGSFISEKEVKKLVESLIAQGKPQYDEAIMNAKVASEVRAEPSDEADEFYDQAIAIVAESRNASISYLQRRLKVGYNRAARMIEQMEAEGVIGPQVGSKPREIFVQDHRGE